MKKIYLDNNATTQMSEEVASSMILEMKEVPSNPSSVHYYGKQARSRLLKARKMIAANLDVDPSQIIFTSGGTESMNFLIHGLCNQAPKGHLISSTIEHPSVLLPLKFLEKQGWELTLISPNPEGFIEINQVTEALKPNTFAMIFSAANSETGVKNDLSSLSSLALDRNIHLLVDAIGIFGKELWSIPEGVLGVGFSGHKFHGPKGIGFCYLRSPHTFDPILIGGGQESFLRSGTENLPAIIGLSHAVNIACSNIHEIANHLKNLQIRFETTLLSQSFPVIVNGGKNRVCNVSNLAFPGVDGETLLIQLDLHGVYASHGSACSSGSLEPSKVLLEMGIERTQARSSIRFSFSKYNTEEEIDYAASVIIGLISQLIH